MHLLYPEGVRKGLPLAKESENKGLPERSEGNSPLYPCAPVPLYPFTPLGYGVIASGEGVRASPKAKGYGVKGYRCVAYPFGVRRRKGYGNRRQKGKSLPEVIHTKGYRSKKPPHFLYPYYLR